MTQKAKRRIDALASLENLKYGYINYSRKLKEKLRKTIEIRVVTERHKPNAFTKELMRYSEASNKRIELRQVEELPFNLMIVDDKEAIWGRFHPKDQNPQSLWTNDPTQIGILKTTFESLWQKSSDIEFGE